jgi:uncharacterized protein (TIRG00374 family)
MLGLAIASLLLFLCFRRIQWDRAWQELVRIRPSWLFLAVAVNLSIFVFWAAQWKVFLPKAHRVSFGRMIEINALMAMVMNTVPFLAGHALGVFLLAKREKVGNAAALSVIALDQLSEGIAKLSVLLLISLLTPLPAWIKKGILLVASGVSLLLLVLFFFSHRYRILSEFTQKQSKPLWKWAHSFISRWAHHLETLRSFRRFSLGILLAWAMKGAEATAIFAVQKGFHLDIPAWSVLLILAGLNLATMIPVTPGNIGVYEATVFFIYQYLGVHPEQALGLALLQHLCYLLPLVGTGYLLVIARNVFPEEPLQPSRTPTP